MRQARLWIEIGVVLLVAIVAFLVGRTLFPLKPTTPAPATPEKTMAAPGNPIPPQVVTAREAVPSGVVVPDKGSTAPSNVAIPTSVVAAGPNTTLKKRSFSLTVDKDKLTPDTMIVEQGDIVEITISAVDKDYSFAQPDYSLGFTVAAGQSQTIQNQFTQTGKFTFYCPSCGGPAAGPRGYIIVVAKNAS